MGYESKLYIVRKHTLDYGHVYTSEIAVFDMGKMGYEEATCIDGGKRTFRNVFTRDIDFDLLVDGEKTQVDCYGDLCQWATPEEVYQWLRHSRVVKEYDRAELLQEYLYKLVTMQEKYRELGAKDEICVVHYGY